MIRPRSVLAAVVAFVLGLFGHPCSAQQWAPGGIRVCQNGCLGDIPRIIPDAIGGAYIAWRNAHNSGDVWLQRITGSGLIAPGWPVDGFPVIVDPYGQQLSGLVPDGFSGAFVVWQDARTTSSDGYVQRVRADGTLPPGWEVGGNPAELAPDAQDQFSIAPDGVGGAYVGWEDWRNYPDRDIYAQHLTASGVPASGWPQNGLGVCVLPSPAGGLVLTLPDDSGGAVFLWGDGRSSGPGAYGQRLRSDGTIPPGWVPNGNAIAIGEGMRSAARDGQGGFYVAASTPGPTPGFDGNYYVLRFTFDGAPAPGWPTGGLLVCNAPGNRAGVTVDSDGAGGLLMTWYDYRPGLYGGGKIFALRILPDGTRAPGWTANGTLVGDPQSGQTYDPFVVNDGQSGAYIAWQGVSADGYFNVSTLQHLTSDGQVAAGWSAYGTPIASRADDQFDTRITSDGQGGAIVTWDDGTAVWAQRFAPLGPTPVLLSPVGAAVKQGRVVLDWHAATSGLQATVYRRTERSDWLALGRVSADGTGELHYEDGAVSPGERYSYRLGYVERGAEQFTAEAWVDVPALVLALEGLRPNPASTELNAVFSLPSSAPAILELLDVGGRRILSQEVGSLGSGRHVLQLGGSSSVPAGLYWLRLRQGVRSMTSQAVVTR